MVSRNYIGEQEENIDSTKKELSAGTERQQHQAQSSEPINPHKEENLFYIYYQV
jgi:hypothetical protein